MPKNVGHGPMHLYVYDRNVILHGTLTSFVYETKFHNMKISI